LRGDLSLENIHWEEEGGRLRGNGAGKKKCNQLKVLAKRTLLGSWSIDAHLVELGGNRSRRKSFVDKLTDRCR